MSDLDKNREHRSDCLLVEVVLEEVIFERLLYAARNPDTSVPGFVKLVLNAAEGKEICVKFEKTDLHAAGDQEKGTLLMLEKEKGTCWKEVTEKR